MKLRIVSFALFATVVGSSSAQVTAPPPAAPSGAFEVNGIAARVNSTVITKSQLNFRLAPIYAQLAAQFPRRGAEFERMVLEERDRLLQEMIDREIILDEFKQLEKKGAALPEHVVDKEMKRQIQANFNGDNTKFEQELSRAGMSREGYRRMTRDQLIVQAIRAEHFSEPAPPLPAEVTKEYNEVKLKLRDTSKDVISFHKIFLPIVDASNPLATPDTQLALAYKLVEDIKGGADFAALAKEHSRDAYSDQGGYQENVARTELQPEFAVAIFERAAGELVGPLADPVGFTIVKIGKITHGPYPPLSEVKDLVEERIRTKKSSAAYERWIEQKRRSAVIDKKI